MGRARYTSQTLHCHSCDRTWQGTVFVLDAHMRDLHALDPHKPCSYCSMRHGEGTICKFLPETCTCDTPHVEIIPRPNSRNLRFAQCRAEQRTAIYRMPDGSISVPSSNAYDDPIALAAISGGGVRDEAYSVRDMVRWQRDQRVSEDDEFSDRCMVIDYDQHTILAGDTLLHDRIKQEDEARQRVYDRELRGEVFFGGDRYEEALRRSGRGGTR